MILVRYTPNSEHLFSLMIDVPEPPTPISVCAVQCGSWLCSCNLYIDEQNNYNKALKQCEDSAIGIDNDDIKLLAHQHVFGSNPEMTWEDVDMKPGQTFPLPDSIGYEIVTLPIDPSYQVARLKLKPLSETMKNEDINHPRNVISFQCWQKLIRQNWANVQGEIALAMEEYSQQQLSEFKEKLKITIKALACGQDIGGKTASYDIINLIDTIKP